MSELQERLEHLINYSSQLIFVSGDSIAQQQRTLEEFLSIQKENTEISYFTSELSMESPDFRRIICRQLLGQKVGSFVRPLKELLKDLHEQPGPFLLCIKQAQTLPNAFLQELWDWVIESKKQNTNHHVNVILFGETAWAAKAKKWLPKRNSSRPVLLSSQSIDSSKFDLNALETLMAEEKPRFSLDLFTRDEFAPPIVTQKWFIAAVLLLLLSVFVGLMSWQYPDHVKSLLQTGTLPPEADLNADQLALVNEQLDREMAHNKEIDKSPLAENQATQPENAALITSWDDAKQSSDNKIESLKNQINEQQDQVSETAAQTIAPLQTDDTPVIVDAETVKTNLADENVDALEGDFAVPDIISIEQLDATLGNDLLPPQNQAIDEVVATSLIAPVNSPALESPIENLYEYDEARLLALSEPAVLLQLSGIQNRTVLTEFIVDNQLQNSVWVYQTTRYGGPWHVVLLNQRFSSVNAARNAVASLPQAVQDTAPFAKELTQIKLEIRNR